MTHSSSAHRAHGQPDLLLFRPMGCFSSPCAPNGLTCHLSPPCHKRPSKERKCVMWKKLKKMGMVWCSVSCTRNSDFIWYCFDFLSPFCCYFPWAFLCFLFFNGWNVFRTTISLHDLMRNSVGLKWFCLSTITDQRSTCYSGGNMSFEMAIINGFCFIWVSVLCFPFY